MLCGGLFAFFVQGMACITWQCAEDEESKCRDKADDEKARMKIAKFQYIVVKGARNFQNRASNCNAERH